MILVPDLKQLEGMSTDPRSGGAWVMWSGTPYAHVMVPVGAAAKSARTRYFAIADE